MRRYLGAVLAALMLLGVLPALAGANHINDHRNIQLPDPEPNDPTTLSIRWSGETFADGSVASVIIGRDDLFPDLLASGFLQGESSPLLLTDGEALSDGILEEITRLGASSFTVVGGTAAVSEAVVTELTGAGLTDDGRLQGATRFETAAAIAAGYTGDTVIIARGESGADQTQAFADSLAAGGWAAAEGWPILLTQAGQLHPAAAAFLDGSSVTHAIVVGGEAAVGGSNEADLAALGLTVTRVAGGGRAATAVAIAEARGHASADAVARFLVVEGQAAEGYALGFPAAAHSAVADAPVVLVVNGEVPPETEAWISGGGGFSVNPDDPSSYPLFICGAAPDVCAGPLREAIGGLPVLGDNAAAITLDTAGGPHPVGATLDGTATFDPDFTATLSLSGDCIGGGEVTVATDGTFTVDITGPSSPEEEGAESGDCPISYLVTYSNGTTQTGTFPADVASGGDNAGVLLLLSGATYDYQPDSGGDTITQTYDGDDAFSVDGTSASIGVFQAQATGGDRITVTDNDDGTFDHDLINVDPPIEGTIGNINTSVSGSAFDQVYAVIEPNSGAQLSGFITYTADCDLFEVDGSTATVAAFEADISEGDTIERSTVGPNEVCSLTNQTVSGTAGDTLRDTTSGLEQVLFRIGNLGDSWDDSDAVLGSLSSADFRFVVDTGYAPDQTFMVDGDSVTLVEFVNAVSDGDQATYARAAGIESFTITNAAPTPTTGSAQEDSDGLAMNTFVLVNEDGPTAVTYDAEATFRIDEILSIEAEFLAAFSAGDTISYTAADVPTMVEEIVSLTNTNLHGDIDDIDTATTRYDVLGPDGTTPLANNLNYTAAVFGGTDRYLIGDIEVSLTAFETALEDADDHPDASAIDVRDTESATEHHLTVNDES